MNDDDIIEEHMEHLDPNFLYINRIKKEKILIEFGFIKEKKNEKISNNTENS